MTKTSHVRLLLVALATLLLAIGAAACGGDDDGDDGAAAAGGEGGKKLTIAVNQYSREIPYFQEILKGMQEKAKEFGWELDTSFANNDPRQQINQLQNAVTTRPDAMVVIPIDEEAIVPPIRQAKDADIPVITMGDNIAEEARDAQVAFLGVAYDNLGAQKATYIVDQLGGKGKVGFVHGIRGLNFTEQQNQGAKEVFENQPEIQLIDGPFTGAFSSDKGLAATENLLSRAGDLDAIYYDNDDIALGGIQAVEERGIPHDDILIVGTDGGPAAIKAVQEGKLDMTVSLCGFRQGKQVMDALFSFLVEEKEPEPLILTETEVFTPDNIDEQIKKVEAGNC